jgi:hypothetical protein
MKWGSTGIVFSPAFLGKLNPNGGRGSRGRAETVDNAVNVVNAEHRRFVNRDNISSSIVMSKIPDALASGELEELGDMGRKESVASIELHRKRCRRIEIQGHGNGKDVMKGAKGYIQIG